MIIKSNKSVKMNIAIITPASLPATQFGGIMFLGLNIAKILSKQNHKATIYTTDMDFANNAHTFNRLLPRIEVTEKFIIKRSHVWFSIYLFFINPGMFKQLSNDKNDIIHSIGVRSFQSLIAAIISKYKKIPLILSDQGGLTTHPDLVSATFKKRLLLKLQKPLIQYIINQASRIIVPNEYEKNIFLNFCDISKISIIKNGIDLDEVNDSEDDFNKKFLVTNNFILFLGRFHTVKGIHYLINSINEIKENALISKVSVILMGVDFGFQTEMENLIKQFGLGDMIKIIVNPSREEVISAYKKCLFLVLPSLWELSPLTPLEAFAHRKTVISTTAHGIPSTIIHNENCILVPPSNSKELGIAILDLLANPEKRELLGENGYKFVTNVANSQIMVNDFFKIYEYCLNVDNKSS